MEDDAYTLSERYRSIEKNIIEQIHAHGLDIEYNHLFLEPDADSMTRDKDDDEVVGIEPVMANKFVKNLHILMRRSHKPILIHQSVGGGEWESGMKIFNAIQACPNPITILVYTPAVSMSSIILQAANKRVMMPDARLMFHWPIFGTSGPANSVFTETDLLREDIDRMFDIYIRSMKASGKFKRWSKDRIREMLTHEINYRGDAYLNAKNTVQWGLADEVFGEKSFNWDNLLEYTDEQLEVK